MTYRDALAHLIEEGSTEDYGMLTVYSYSDIRNKFGASVIEMKQVPYIDFDDDKTADILYYYYDPEDGDGSIRFGSYRTEEPDFVMEDISGSKVACFILSDKD